MLGDELTYEVDEILVVKPEESDVLRIEDGKDYVTLLTCTPVNVNSHRLLVRGVRVPDAPSAGGHLGADDNRPTGSFPWWLVGYVAVLLVSAVLTLAPLRPAERRRPRSVARKHEPSTT